MIITLCGSGRFEKWFHNWNKALSLSGHVVLGMSSYPSQNQGVKDWFSQEDKAVLDRVHKDKIALSDVALFLNVFGYMGESTLSELAYAQRVKKTIFFLESWGKGCGVGGRHNPAYQSACEAYGVPFNASPVATHEIGNCWPTELLAHPCGPERTRLLKLVEKDAP
jgi:hypothetical protein